MVSRFPLVWFLASVITFGCATSQEYEPQSGDILFQTSLSSQSRAIQIATDSPYSHMGIVQVDQGVPWVLEAVDPVKLTRLADWVARGKGGHFVAKRLQNADSVLVGPALEQLVSVGREYLGRPYDWGFEWSDEKLYCSELVWKVYDRAIGVEIGALETLGDFDLTDQTVRREVEKRWGGSPPEAEPVVSPARMFHSEVLVTVYQN